MSTIASDGAVSCFLLPDRPLSDYLSWISASMGCDGASCCDGCLLRRLEWSRCWQTPPSSRWLGHLGHVSAIFAAAEALHVSHWSPGHHESANSASAAEHRCLWKHGDSDCWTKRRLGLSVGDGDAVLHYWSIWNVGHGDGDGGTRRSDDGYGDCHLPLRRHYRRGRAGFVGDDRPGSSCSWSLGERDDGYCWLMLRLP